MTVAYEDGRLTLHSGDCMDVMPTFEADSIDAIVTDPPYDLTATSGRRGSASVFVDNPYGRARIGSKEHTSLTGGFMGQTWDGTGVAFRPETWVEALRVAKPGGHLLAFGGTRTHHRLTSAIEDAGWEIRDCLVWAYAQGFPKSHNLPGGLGTALKPAWEPIVMARKPLQGTVAANLLQFGTGILDIDGARIDANGRPRREIDPDPAANGAVYAGRQAGGSGFDGGSKAVGTTDLGRWPANVLLTDPIFDGESPGVVGGGDQKGGGNPRWRSEEASAKTFGGYETGNPEGYTTGKVPVDTAGTYSRFFLIPKAGRRERNAGLEGLEDRPMLWSSGSQNPGSFQSPNTKRAARNPHPTVKPVELMSHLVRLVTPRGGSSSIRSSARARRRSPRSAPAGAASGSSARPSTSTWCPGGCGCSSARAEAVS